MMDMMLMSKMSKMSKMMMLMGMWVKLAGMLSGASPAPARGCTHHLLTWYTTLTLHEHTIYSHGTPFTLHVHTICSLLALQLLLLLLYTHHQHCHLKNCTIKMQTPDTAAMTFKSTGTWTSNTGSICSRNNAIFKEGLSDKAQVHQFKQCKVEK